MTQRVVVITGARRGIGLSAALHLRRVGFRVVGIDLQEAEQSDCFDRFILGDLRDPAVLRGVLQNDVPAVGSLHGLVNNAVVPPPVSPPTAFVDATLDDLDSAYSVNVRVLFDASQQVARQLIKNGSGGSIVNLGSIHGERGASGMAIYGTTKGAVAALTRSVAVELAPHRIRCNCLAPSPVATPALVENLTKAGMEQRVRQIPYGRFAEQDEVARAVTFLISDESTFVTGATVPVDGGYLAFGMA